MFNINAGDRSINAFLIVFVSALLVSCAGSTKIAEDKLMIEMKKTPCYGQCPVYTIKIDESGNGLFAGIENTEHIGLFSFRLRTEEMEALKSSFKEIRFFDLEDRYFEHVTDLPTTYVTYRSGDREKKIMDYYGAPRELKDLERQIASLVLSKKMKRVR